MNHSFVEILEKMLNSTLITTQLIVGEPTLKKCFINPFGVGLFGIFNPAYAGNDQILGT